MNNNDNAPTINTESTGYTPMLGTIVLLQQLDNMMHEAEVLSAKIRKEARLEAARLIEDVDRQISEIINQTQWQAKVPFEKEKMPSGNAPEDIGKYPTGYAVKNSHKFLPAMDYLAEKSKSLEEGLGAAINVAGQATSKARIQPEDVAEADKTTSELIKEAIGSREVTKVNPSSSDQTGKTEVTAKDEVKKKASSEPKSPQEDSDLYYGEVKIEMAPPVSSMRLLGLTRSLMRTRGIRILGTSGSRNSGNKITLLLDKPLPLLSLLRDTHLAEGIIVEDKPVPHPAPEQSDIGKISIDTKDDGYALPGNKSAVCQSLP